ncbi:aspartyl-tRNA synthetase [Ureibacillus sp. MALMAid1270]|uniref:aspartyl-tRNA synthetase n=1 Tax=Ureibacillus sp. MALMAid1270 TaxID=3411629 RepID=UPI003BA6CFE1
MKKRTIIPVIIFIISITVIWGVFEKLQSYAEPQEAILAIENDLVLIPGYKLNDKALFFFIKDGNSIGSTYVYEGLFGWKADVLTWGSMDQERNYERLNGYKGHGENLVYGLIRHGHERKILIGENEARILDLAMLPSNEVEKYNLEGLSIWYFESETSLSGEEIKLVDKYTGEEIDSERFR